MTTISKLQIELKALQALRNISTLEEIEMINILVMEKVEAIEDEKFEAEKLPYPVMGDFDENGDINF